MINYVVIPRKNPQTKAVKYYAQARRTTPMNLDQIAENISRECTVHKADIKAVLTGLEEQVMLALQNGNSVLLGDLGSFRATIKSKGVDAAKDFSVEQIESVKVSFRASSALRQAFKKSAKGVQFNNTTQPAAEATTTE